MLFLSRSLNHIVMHMLLNLLRIVRTWYKCAHSIHVDMHTKTQCIYNLIFIWIRYQTIDSYQFTLSQRLYKFQSNLFTRKQFLSRKCSQKMLSTVFQRNLKHLLSNTIYSQTLQTHRFNSFWDYFDNKFNGANLMSKQWENECVKRWSICISVNVIWLWVSCIWCCGI